MSEKDRERSQEDGMGIFIVGSTAVGKTTAGDYLGQDFDKRELPHNRIDVADSSYLLEAMYADDRSGGMHHGHPGYDVHPDHDKGIPRFPFIVTDNTIPSAMRVGFSNAVTELDTKKEIRVVECATGENLTDIPVDYSGNTVMTSFREAGVTPELFGEKFCAVVHITADYDTRLALNQQTHLSKKREIPTSTADWKKDETVLLLYGNDDVKQSMGDFFDRAGVPVFIVKNNGSPDFFEKLNETAYQIVRRIAQRKTVHFIRTQRKGWNIPSETIVSPIELTQEEQNELDSILNPSKLYNEEGSRVIIPVGKRLERGRAIHQGPHAFIVELRDPYSGRLYLGKILRPGYTGVYRDQRDIATRQSILQHNQESLTRESPTVLDSFRPIIHDWKKTGLVTFGKKMKSTDLLDSRLEYILIMNVFSRDNLLGNVLKRDVTILPALANALVAINQKSLVLTLEEAWKTARLETYEEKFRRDLDYYIRTMMVLMKQGYIDTGQVNLDEQLRVIDRIFQHPEMERIRYDEVASGRVGAGLGNIYASNVFVDNHYRNRLITDPSKCFAFIDPADAHPDLRFTEQTFGGEFAMMSVDVERLVPYRYAAQFNNYYLYRTGIRENPHARANVLVEKILKSMTRTHFARRDGQLPLAAQYASIAHDKIMQAGILFAQRGSMNRKAALNAG